MVQEQEQQQQQRCASAGRHWGAALPWSVLPGAVAGVVELGPLLDEVRLQRDEVVLADGRRVPESRLTAWLSDAGHSFCYSGGWVGA